MNVLDIYDFEDNDTPPPGPSTAAASTSKAPSTEAPASADAPTLNEEVQQVFGTLNKFWGGFRKQSVDALESARKDLASVAVQAQKELGKLQQIATAPTSPDPDASTDSSPPTTTTSTSATATGDATSATSSSPPDSGPSTTSPVSTISSNLLSYLPVAPAQLGETIQKTLSEGSTTIQTSLQRTLSNPEVQNIRSTLAANLHTLQENVTSGVHHLQENVTSGVHQLQENLPNLQNQEVRDKLLEDARKQGVDWLKDAGEFFKEAVKVVPPAPGEQGYQPGMIWDGSDVWMFSSARDEDDSKPVASDEKGKGKGIATSRTGALLRTLRTDPEMIRAAPSGETYEWFCKEIDAKDGGLGSAEWKKKCDEVSKLDGLDKLKESLVPSELDEETFWRRYWFRAWQIQQEEEKRKALLEASAETAKEEDFSWEDDEENEVQRTPKVPESSSSVTKIEDGPSSSVTTLTSPPATTPAPAKDKSNSPRESEDSYDVVSTISANASTGGLSPPAQSKPIPSALGSAPPITAPAGDNAKTKTKTKNEDSEDSDWD